MCRGLTVGGNQKVNCKIADDRDKQNKKHGLHLKVTERYQGKRYLAPCLFKNYVGTLQVDKVKSGIISMFRIIAMAV